MQNKPSGRRTMAARPRPLDVTCTSTSFMSLVLPRTTAPKAVRDARAGTEYGPRSPPDPSGPVCENPERVDESPQGGCHLPLRRVTKIESGKRRGPGFEQGDERASLEIRSDQFLGGESDPETLGSRFQAEALAVANQRSLDLNFEPFTVTVEFPLVGQRMSFPPPAYTTMGRQLAGAGGRAVTGQILRRGHRDLPQIGTELHGNHVTLDHFTDPDRRIVISGHEVHDFIVQGDIEHDIRTGCLE